MVKPKVGFVVYGVHKDGLKDRMGQPFIDGSMIENAKKALLVAGLDLVVEDLVIATKKEARACFSKFKKMDNLDVWNNEYAVLGYGSQLYEDLLAFCELTGIHAIAL